MLNLLLPLLTSGTGIKSLTQILGAVLGSGDPRDAAEALLEKRLDAQAGRTAGKTLGRAVCEAIDQVLEAPGLSIEEKEQVATLLATNAALQLSQAAELILLYPQKQAAVVRAKAGTGDTSAEVDAARQERNRATEQVKNSFVDVTRVVCGEKPKDL